MGLEMPDTMDDCVYFTRRKFTPNKGKAVAWVRRIPCAVCKKGMMQKPKDEKKGTFKIRSKEFICTECGEVEEKSEHEKKLSAEIIYQCPFCSHDGEIVTPYARKSFYGKKAIVFNCEECDEKLGITKKMTLPDKFAEKLKAV